MRDKVLRVFEMYAEGGTVGAAMDAVGISRRDFYRTMRQDPELKAIYYEIQEGRADMMYDEAYEIGTSEAVNPQRARVQSEIRMKIAAAFDRKRFGEKVQLDVQGNVSVIGALEAARQRALPPPRDLGNVIEGQAIELPSLPEPQPTDKASGARPVVPPAEDPAGIFDD